MTVLVSGIGIAGPTLAYWLSRYGIKVTLMERAPRLRTGGYVIDFWGSGYEIADRMGLLPDIQREGYRIKELRILNARGRRIGGFDADVFRAATFGRFVSLSRGDLARIIYQKVEGRCETVFGDSITGIRQDPNGVDVSFEHAAPRRFDVVIGADGLHSTVRKLAFGNEAQFEKFLGYSVAAFAVAGYQPGDEDVYIGYGVPGRQVARFAMRDNRTMFLFIFADPGGNLRDADDTKAQKEVLCAAFGDAGWECPQILAALESCDEIYFDRMSQIRMDAWSQGRVGLVGDAAFCPSLLAGQGSALAMVAAYVLAGELGRAGATPEAAFSRYEQLLRPFITGKQNAAEGMGRSFAPRTRLGLFLRNQTTKFFLLPLIPRLLMGRSLIDRIELPTYSR